MWVEWMGTWVCESGMSMGLGVGVGVCAYECVCCVGCGACVCWRVCEVLVWLRVPSVEYQGSIKAKSVLQCKVWVRIITSAPILQRLGLERWHFGRRGSALWNFCMKFTRCSSVLTLLLVGFFQFFWQCKTGRSSCREPMTVNCSRRHDVRHT